MPTNAQAMRAGKVPCEWEPGRERPARTGDPFHGRAELVGGRLDLRSGRADRQLRVCRGCARLPEVRAYVRTPGRDARFLEIED